MSAWTKSDLATLERMARKGAPASEIARSLGRSRTAVYKMARKAGVSLRQRRRWTVADDEALRRAVASGAKASDAAWLLGRTRDAVFSRMRALGLSSLSRRRYDWDAVDEMLAAGVPAEEAAASQGTTRRLLDEAMRSRRGESYSGLLGRRDV